LLAFEYNKFNGIIIDSAEIPVDEELFLQKLSALLVQASLERKSVIWLTLPIDLAHLIKIATSLGFTFHNCLPTEVTLTYKSLEEDYVPFVPTHSLGAGGLVQNALGQILVIRERGASTYKLPGGHIELGEKIEDAVIREVLEETGIETSFDSVLGMASTHPYRFGKSNIYIVCKLLPVTTKINVLDTDEIDEAKWLLPQEFLADSNNSPFNKYLVKSLVNVSGLSKSTLDLSQFSKRKHEVFLAC
jgi:8-oxo-dGTP pyrophosphatase MutT (NUDIX family)